MNINFRKQDQGSRLLPAAIATPLAAAAGLLAGYLVFGRRGKSAAPVSSGKRVDEAMTRDPQSIAPFATVADAARLMRSEDVGSLPVVSEGRLVGVITDRDIATRLVADGDDAHATTVGQIASADVVTVSPQEELDAALGLMAEHQVRRLPVVEQDRLVGVVAQADVAREAHDEQTGEVVEQISR